MGNLGILIRNGIVGTKQGPVVLVLLHQIKMLKYIYYYVLLQMERTHQFFPTSSYVREQLVGQPAKN